MSKTRIFALSLVALMLLAVFLNPKEEQHKERMRAKAVELLKQEAGAKHGDLLDVGMNLFGGVLLDQFVDSRVRAENYYLFSLTKLRAPNEEITVGLGAFGKVWLSPKLDEKVAELGKWIKQGY